MRPGKFVVSGLLALSVLVAPAWADTGIDRGSVGISQATADDTYATLAGEDQYTGEHDHSGGTLLAAIAAAANQVMTQAATDARHPQLGAASNTYTGVYLGPDGTNEAPTWSYTSETKTGWYLSKAARMGASVGGVLVCTLDATTLDHDGSLDIGVDGTFGGNLDVTGNGVFDGNTTFGDARTDDMSIWPDQILFLSTNSINFNGASDFLFDGAALTRFDMEVQVASDLDAEADIFAGGRLHTTKGSDIASADEIALGADGNYFDITGTTTINHITKTGWLAGAVVVLQFDASVTVTHNAGSPAGTEASILLSGAGNFSATADDTLQLVYDGTTWREIGRAVI